MEGIIKEYETKEILIEERRQNLELRSLELTKQARENERRFQERQDALDQRERDITAYQNKVFQEQDQRAQEIEKISREREQALDQRQRSIDRA